MNRFDDASALAGRIDHTLLGATATPQQIRELCEEALRHSFASVCVNTCHTALVAEALRGGRVKTCVVVGFPLGAGCSQSKVDETACAVSQGAQEVDMVINIGMLKAGEDDYVEQDIRGVVEAASGNTVKVIIECCYLDEAEKVRACLLAAKAGAHFVKTSTGFGTSGATVEDVALMRKTVPKLQVKASGGIRDRAAAIAMLEAGADRLGTSSGVIIVGSEAV